MQAGLSPRRRRGRGGVRGDGAVVGWL